MQHSWWTASSDVKQLIVQAADPQTARNLCSLDHQLNDICRERLPVEQKYRICLGGANDAVECDKISIFSERQFTSLIPERIEIYPRDAVQLTHEFYSQTYKLPQDDAATTLRKAKLMNTICAIIRPDFLLTPEAKVLPLPPYVDAALLDSVSRQYIEFIARGVTNPETTLIITITLNHAVDSKARIRLLVDYTIWEDWRGPYKAELYVNEMLQLDVERFINNLNADAYIASGFKDNVKLQKAKGRYRIPTLSFPGHLSTLNVFEISRLLKIAFDLGYYQSIVTLIDEKDTEIMSSSL